MATNNLHLPQYKIPHVQVIEQEDCGEISIFVTAFLLGQYTTVVLFQSARFH
jgi:hypothetical protein